jgi:hypothetical protein
MAAKGERKRTAPRGGRGESGQAIVETMLTMILLCLILFGLLQVFQIAVANMVTSYSAFMAGRSYAVGFSADGGGGSWRNLVGRAANVAAIGASGKRLWPDRGDYGSTADLGLEMDVLVPEYIEGIRDLEYEYWYGGNEYDYAYYRAGVEPSGTYFQYNVAEQGDGTVELTTTFSDYPFPVFDLMDPDRVWFDTVGDSRNVSGTARIYNHAADFMEE